MSYETPITDMDLHAYLDGQLSEARRIQVENWLKQNPDRLKELNEFQIVDRELHQLLDPIIKEPVPDHLQIRPRKHFFYRVAAAASFIFIGTIIGWQSNTMLAGSDQQQIQHHLIQPANFAHVVFSAEKKHPVEVDATQEQHLIKWLSKRLHADIKAPNLLQHGYELVGGRLLPSTNRMAAQFMYQNKAANRITLYVRRINKVDADSMFQFSNTGSVNTFYWIEGELGYALSGEMERSELLTMARSTYQQLNID
ncbi:MAG: anti-sigma factor [Gammaproteobacteria bacterium]|nr:anti-sigma factor [Gammaproteobacteria bacterium]